MHIALVRPMYKSHIITPPLGIGYLSSYLKKNGIATTIIDGLRENLGPEEMVGRIIALKPDLVGITCLTAFYTQTVRLARLLKKNGIRVVIGGVHPTFMPRSTLTDSGADFVICGEAEIALLRLVRNNLVNDGIPGVYAADYCPADGGTIGRGEVVEDLDAIPWPDWEQMQPALYPPAPHGAIAKNFPIGIITSTRGCPYACTFCASPKFYNQRIRYRSPENVVDEIQHLVSKFGVREIHFEDDNLTLKRTHVEKICMLILERKIKISWACPNGIRADRVDEPLIRLMAKAGCYYFAYGIESANAEVLKKINKKETAEEIRKSIEIAKRVGISCQGFFIFGLPGETKDSIEETIMFARTSKLSRAQFLILDVIPGSELWDTLNGKFVPDWNKDSYKEPEWIPEGLTREKLMKAQSRAFRSFYLRPGIFFNLARSIRPGQIKYLIKRLLEYRIIPAR